MCQVFLSASKANANHDVARCPDTDELQTPESGSALACDPDSNGYICKPTIDDYGVPRPLEARIDRDATCDTHGPTDWDFMTTYSQRYTDELCNDEISFI